jgi:3-keto-disaccharide hydrolase
MILKDMFVAAILAGACFTSIAAHAAAPCCCCCDGWISLFDGHSLDGWTANEHKDSCRVENGTIVVGGGDRSHLYYSGPVRDHNFKNFELKAQVKTEPGSNSGIFFHTTYQDSDWPKSGYEAQVNNTHEDWRKTGSLYDVEDVRQSPVEDGQWFDYHIIVRGKRIILKVNGETTVDYTEPDDPQRPEERSGRVLSSGTIALQAHDPGSTVYFRNIRIKPLP